MKGEKTTFYRIGILMLGAGMVFAALIGRLYFLQIVKADYLTEVSKNSRTYVGISGRNGWLPPSRGLILDRNGRALAQNRYQYTVVANEATITNATDPILQEEEKKLQAVDTIQRAGAILKMSPLEMEKQIAALQSPKFKAREIQRDVPESIKDKLEKADVPGISFTAQSIRFYPEGFLAGHVIGYTDAYNNGLAGIELVCNEILDSSRAAKVVEGEKDKSGKLLANEDYTKKITSRVDVTLTIDSYIQYVVERELAKKVVEVDANYANAVALHAKTGEVLAMANYPAFDPNEYSKYPEEIRQNQMLTGVYEPGSVLKPFILAAALDKKVVSPDTVFYCENGSYYFRGKTIRDDIHRFENLSVHDIIVHSSNIGMVKIAARLGAGPDDWKGQARILYDYLTRFGFKNGSKYPTFELPGESGGILRTPEGWTAASLGAIPFGQEISTNTLIIAAAYGAIANRGLYRKPHIIKGYKGMDGVFYPQPMKTPTRIVPSEVMEEIVKMMVDVTEIEDGTGRKVRIPGFHIAGKSGTAQKYDPQAGTYGYKMRIASFAGFFPAEDPQVVIAVMVDEPKKAKYGGDVAGPVWKTIAEEIIAYWGLTPTNKSDPLLALGGESPHANAETKTDIPAPNTFGVTRVLPAPPAEPWDGGQGVMPNLLSWPLRDAVVRLTSLGLRASFQGAGKVVEQEIPPGTPLGGKQDVGVIRCEPVLTDSGVAAESKLVVQR
ncbi:MAG: penicillin-binding protein [Candidatus Omnitrophota bacterium]